MRMKWWNMRRISPSWLIWGTFLCRSSMGIPWLSHQWESYPKWQMLEDHPPWIWIYYPSELSDKIHMSCCSNCFGDWMEKPHVTKFGRLVSSKDDRKMERSTPYSLDKILELHILNLYSKVYVTMCIIQPKKNPPSVQRLPPPKRIHPQRFLEGDGQRTLQVTTPLRKRTVPLSALVLL